MELMEKHNIVKKKFLVDESAEADLSYQRFMELQHFPPTKQSNHAVVIPKYTHV